jgi:hypothetical protein
VNLTPRHNATVVETAVVHEALGKFVDGVIARLEARGRPPSPLHDLWRVVRETAPEAEDYCRLFGALGFVALRRPAGSPYTTEDLVAGSSFAPLGWGRRFEFLDDIKKRKRSPYTTEALLPAQVLRR